MGAGAQARAHTIRRRRAAHKGAVPAPRCGWGEA